MRKPSKAGHKDTPGTTRTATTAPLTRPTTTSRADERQREPTAFESRVYEMLKSRVPKGRVTSYAALAKALNSSARAVGGAMRRNPFAPTVPCHRVVCADGSLGGFSGMFGNPKKERLLLEEGVLFQTGKNGTRVVHESCFVVDFKE